MQTYWLSMHVSYGCRHAGACCSAGWPIPIERARAAAVGLLRGDGSWLVPAPDAPPEVAGTIAVTAGGHCVFHGDGCGIQRALGHAALPSACQHFPREVLIDGRGALVTLSHFCPTAADLLFEHEGAVEIVEGPPAVPGGDPEGLDARDVLPPLLTKGVLMDLDGYSAWEAHMVRVLSTDDGRSARAAVTTLERDLAMVQRWRPGDCSLSEEISRLPVTPAAGTSAGRGMNEMIIRRYLAARAFASWMAYQGGDISAVLGSLRVALSVLDEESAYLPLKDAIRRADLRLLHLMPRASLVAMARQR